MAGRFGKYGDIKRREALQRSNKAMAMLTKASSVDRRYQRPYSWVACRDPRTRFYMRGASPLSPTSCGGRPVGQNRSPSSDNGYLHTVYHSGFQPEESHARVSGTQYVRNNHGLSRRKCLRSAKPALRKSQRVCSNRERS